MENNLKFCNEYPLFNELSAEQMTAVKKLCREECFYPGYIMFKEGEPATKMYALAEGEIEVFYTIGEAEMVRVDQAGRHEILGCAALIPPYVYTSTACVKTRAVVLELDSVALRKLFEEDPRLAVSIQRQIIECLQMRIVDLRLG
jgi:voltage-gated potassium channel